MRACKMDACLFKGERMSHSKSFFKPTYWKNKYEVDLVYDDSHMVVPVEVKYREQPTCSDVKGIY
jgi:predicted AAA+ superfamily ATPase